MKARLRAAKPVHDVDQHAIVVPRGLLHAKAWGTPGAPAVLLMGSLASDSASWAPQVPALCEAGFHVVTFDWRGHGESSPSVPPFDIRLFCDDLRAVSVHFGLEKPHLIGLSLGGVVALETALEGRQALGKIVVASTRPDMPRQLAQGWAARAQWVREQGAHTIADETLERWFTAGFKTREPDTYAQMREMILRTDRNAYADCVEIVKGIDFLRRLPSVRQPVLYLVGSEDTASPPALMLQMQGRTRGSVFEKIESAAHLPSIEQPQAFNRSVIQFLKA